MLILAGGAGVVGLGFLLAEFDPTSTLSQYGVLGIVVLSLFTGWIVPGPASKAKDKEIERLQIEVQRLQGLFENHLIPITSEYAASMQESSRVLGLALEALNKSGGPK